ncbi:hypothetical protein K3495_g5569 [Podosphaera aphanis]|nr:hypothetical protein K3495_g5569 [Podosphaera aphanis]
MSPSMIAQLRQETIDMFYHGFDNYMNIAFPEDELRPVSCIPLTRDQQNPRNVELNDVLGNYSLTLIDSLSSLAILASSPPDLGGTGEKALRDFQDGVAALVLHYGDGTQGPAGQGLRGRGFDVDSKVQVFETVIRGVGGLLSAHLFAAGELPISQYKPEIIRSGKWNLEPGQAPTIAWPNGLNYNGQLLRLALDLAQRLLPAFYTATGMPYPRVNLRHGIPFYVNSPLHRAQEPSNEGPVEITETCSAGAGSLVLEFTVLSRLTDDPRFEQLAKRAFWAVWEKRSSIGLLGAGIDAEDGQWIGPYSGIGAGTDSFFEYALKTYILLSGHEQPNTTRPYNEEKIGWLDPNTIHHPLTSEENSPAAFLAAWHEAHSAVKRYLYSSTHHPHYINVHLSTGSPQAYWIDSLSAYYPGLLALAGEIEEAIETNLLYTALWTRYSALPERWSVRDGQVEGDLGWWPGRPEFIESNYHLYRATKDPWYLYVGEMVLKDIKRRCWTECGWSGLQDVRTGEKSDRMESFFLGETAKYLYLLFDPDHPLNKLDSAFVFTTEGHPLIIPSNRNNIKRNWKSTTASTTTAALQQGPGQKLKDTCPLAPSLVPLTISATAARRDIFHASSLIGLHLLPNHHLTESIQLEYPQNISNSLKDEKNYTYYPWTLPHNLMPANGICDLLPLKNTITIEFPTSASIQTTSTSNFIVFSSQNLLRVAEGILVKSLSGLKLSLVHETLPLPYLTDGASKDTWRVWSIANIPLGRDEQIFISRDVMGEMADPSFTRIRNTIMLDLVLQLESETSVPSSGHMDQKTDNDNSEPRKEDSKNVGMTTEYKTLISSLLQSFTSILSSPIATPTPPLQNQQTYNLNVLPAILPSGLGAAPLPDVPDAKDPGLGPLSGQLTWDTIFFAGNGCEGKIDDNIPKNHQILVLRRRGCSFSEKLSNIPSYAPKFKSLQLVIIISDENDEDYVESDSKRRGWNKSRRDNAWNKKNKLIRPLLDKVQMTPSGLIRHNQISMVMVGGGIETENLLRRTRSLGARRRYHVESQGCIVQNIVVF